MQSILNNPKYGPKSELGNLPTQFKSYLPNTPFCFRNQHVHLPQVRSATGNASGCGGGGGALCPYPGWWPGRGSMVSPWGDHPPLARGGLLCAQHAAGPWSPCARVTFPAFHTLHQSSYFYRLTFMQILFIWCFSWSKWAMKYDLWLAWNIPTVLLPGPHLGAGDGWLRMTIDHGFPPLTQLLQAAVVCIT